MAEVIVSDRPNVLISYPDQMRADAMAATFYE